MGNYIYSLEENFKPTDVLKHQKFLVMEQLKKSNMKLKNHKRWGRSFQMRRRKFQTKSPAFIR
jgi:hypothetical protein